MALSHHTLVAWQRADDLFLEIHVLFRTFPAIERDELAPPARRAAYSVAADIVEGSGRRAPRDRLHFLHLVFAELEIELKRVGAPPSGLLDQLGRVRRV
jgi:four helix bundle protein